MKKSKVIVLAGCIFSCFHAAAQFNDSVHYRFRYTATGSLNKTNGGNAYLLSNGVGFNLNKQKITSNTYANWVYGQQNKTLTNNDFSAITDIDFLKKVHRLYFWSLLNYETSYSLKTKYLFQPGAGIGYVFLDSAGASLIVSDGILYEVANLTSPTFGKEKYQTLRNSLRVKYHFVISNVVVLDGADYWQPSLSSFKDYIYKLNNTLSFRLRQWLNLTAAFSYNKISRTNSENLLLTFGITLDKYF